jgi:hypothetical protein
MSQMATPSRMHPRFGERRIDRNLVATPTLPCTGEELPAWARMED